MRPSFSERAGVTDAAAAPSTVDERALTARDTAQLLYRHGLGGLLVTAAASASLVLMQPQARTGPVIWLVVMLLILVARSADHLASRKRRAEPHWDGRREIRRWSIGVLATAGTWAFFPPLFFTQLNGVERMTTTVIVSAMAAGSATTLSASLPLAIVYCASLLLPISCMFLITPGRENGFVGLLGFVFLFVMAVASRVTNDALMSSIRLNRANQILLTEMEQERRRTERANRELTAADATLHQTLETLEERIRDRTADLEHEITERERYGRELARVASTDGLTGLLNRSNLSAALDAELVHAERASEPVAVVFLDLDRFKEVNDVKGHFAGDRVLRELAHRFASAAPAESLIARWGGDEFVFVFKDHDAPLAITIASELRRRVGEPIALGSDTVHVGATVGIAMFPEHGHTSDDLIRAADMAMYAGKYDGRGHVRLFDPALAETVTNRHLLSQALREAVSGERLRLEFQPIVSTENQCCTSLEALLRWDHPVRGAIPPGEFIPLAEASGEIIAIGRWVLLAACAAAVRWPGDPAPAVSVNVSVAQLLAGTLIADVEDALEATHLDPRRLHLEVTESLFVSDHAEVVSMLSALRGIGVRISLDDFGTGFSSLGSLRTLPIDIIKIDRSFVATMEGESAPIIAAICSLCRAFEIELIAEGVETATQAAALQALKVHYLQGYWLSRPLPSAAVGPWLIAAGERATAAVRSNGVRLRQTNVSALTDT